MTKFLYLIIFVHLSCLSFSQDSIKNFVKQNQIGISTISPDSTNFDDLEPIGNAIGNSTMVMLGEQDHGDAPTFLAKSRIIKYLHEKKGFNILAFESDFFAFNEGWNNLSKKRLFIDTFISRNMSPIWTECNACQNLLYNYIPETYTKSNPLILTGFDSEVFFSYSSKYLFHKLDSVLKKIKAPITQLPNYSSEIFQNIENWYNYHTDTAKLNNIIYNLSQIKKQLNASLGDTNFWSILCENLLQNNFKFSYATEDKIRGTQIRDSLMAINLKWLTEIKFANEKIIVWAANSHVQKFSGNFTLKFLNTVNSMGSIYTRDSLLKKKSYILGFTSLKGIAGRIGSEKYNINKPKGNSFENWINKSFNYAFVNFRNYTNSKNEVFYMSGFGHNNYEGIWNKVYDGVFFIKEMYPCSK